MSYLESVGYIYFVLCERNGQIIGRLATTKSEPIYDKYGDILLYRRVKNTQSTLTNIALRFAEEDIKKNIDIAVKNHYEGDTDRMLEIVNEECVEYNGVDPKVEERNRVKRIETYNRKQMEASRELNWIRNDKALLELREQKILSKQ